SRRSTLDATSFNHLFSQMVSSESFGVSKPDPSIFEHTAKLAGYKTEECLYFGDHPVKDILGATGSGMRAVWLAGFHDEISLPKEVVMVNNLNDALKIVNL
ncbi:HAD family hydrolase, partial [Aliivibrio kagoshimensis]|uniref:HAD family hydrolase n=1 Tax=Aliivibrio kagoshimensis TaxID=2910230 RepID=UPI003D100E90